MASDILVVLGSARKQSDTENLLRLILPEVEYTLLDLLDYKITPYCYSGNYPTDDAFEQVTTALLRHEVIIWATPVYWYAMSGLLKTCFDRLNDLITIRKETGRKLKGKNTFLIAVGADAELPDGFLVPFKDTAAYLDMHFQDYFYAATKELTQPVILPEKAKQFKTNIIASVKK